MSSADDNYVNSIPDAHQGPPSAWLGVMSYGCVILAVAAAFGAFLFQRASTEPIGEGEVFVRDVATANQTIAADSSLAEGVRHARNTLDIEAVSLVGADGVVTASTSESLVQKPVTNPLLVFGITGGRFAALAAHTPDPIEIDGVVEWPVESILYQVVSPLEDSGGALLLHYDVSQLLGRRAQPGEIQTLTLQLLALAGVFSVFAIMVRLGHSKAVRRYRDMSIESELLRANSRELESKNLELANAQRAAERALALSEEKMRIRSEFVLMINHELRTPLTAVVTGAEMIKTEVLTPEERDEVLNSMVKDGARLQEIIDQMLAVARIENQGLRYRLDSVALDDVCAALQASHHAATPGLDGHGTARTMVLTDVRTLSMVVASLADNARTHGATQVSVLCSPDPVVQPMMEVGQRPPQSVFFAIEDDGPGIDAHFLPRIFEKFEKHSFSSGTGLGLYMARLMVEALEGSIAVETSPTGTTFQIAIPAVVTPVYAGVS